MKRPELSQELLDILYTCLDIDHHETVYKAVVEGERELQAYKEYYYSLMWEEEQHWTAGQA